MHKPDDQPSADNKVPFSSTTPAPTPTTPATGLRLGELLVRQGVLTARQVTHILDVQAAVGRPFGDLAERLFGVPPFVVAAAWVEQFVAVHGERDVRVEAVDPACIAMLDARQAWQFRLVPMRRELDGDGEPGHLLVAAGRQGLRRAMTFAARTLPIAPSFVIATPASLRELLERHYAVSRPFANWAFHR